MVTMITMTRTFMVMTMMMTTTLMMMVMATTFLRAARRLGAKGRGLHRRGWGAPRLAHPSKWHSAHGAVLKLLLAGGASAACIVQSARGTPGTLRWAHSHRPRPFWLERGRATLAFRPPTLPAFSHQRSRAGQGHPPKGLILFVGWTCLCRRSFKPTFCATQPKCPSGSLIC